MAISPNAELQVSVQENHVPSEKLLAALLAAPQVKQYFQNVRFRVLDVQFFEPDEKELRQFKCQSPFSNSYQVLIYDYTHSRCVHLIVKSIKDLTLEITTSSFQPEPTEEEFQEAVHILTTKDEKIKAALSQQAIILYKPMPPTVSFPLADGTIERTLTIGIRAQKNQYISEIVGVNMIRNEVMHFPDRVPSGDNVCGVPNAGQPTTNKGISGQSWVTVTQGGVILWKFLVIRPSASSGAKGSGIELKYVDYKGKRVLYQGHVPILNVRYDNDACPGSPFRDWQYSEGMFQANGNDVAPGVRFCSSPAKTILDTENDAGNFKGVAIYVQGLEVVLVSEMEAGWYRYISEWRLHGDGTIKPRFGFTAVNTSACVCIKHHHHVYWRLDFDIGTSGNNLVEEFNDPILIPPSNWHKKIYEIRRQKDPSRKRKWRITNTQTHQGYEIIPGDNDGVADSYGVGDLWVLRYKGGNEIDDGVTATFGTPDECKAHIDKFVNGELVENQDVVIWYAAHFTHDVSVEAGHIVGPILKPITA